MEKSSLKEKKEESNETTSPFPNISLKDMEEYETINRELNEIINNINTKFDFKVFNKEKLKPIKKVINLII